MYSKRHHGTAVKKVFDRNAKMLQRSRMAMLPDSAEYEYLKKEVNKRLLDRLEDVYSHTFESVLEVGSGAGTDTVSFLSEREDVKHIIQVDNSFKLITRDDIDSSIRGTFWKQVEVDQTFLCTHFWSYTSSFQLLTNQNVAIFAPY
jgi:hypothetical protein